MYNTLLEDMNKFMGCSNDEQKVEMVESLLEKLWEKCTPMQRIEIVSIFTDAIKWR